jgi:hypothetical protein
MLYVILFVVLIFILSHLTNSAGSLKVEFIEGNRIQIMSTDVGSYVVLQGPVYDKVYAGMVYGQFVSDSLDPLSKYTVTILSPDLTTVMAHGTFTTPLQSSSPAPLTN